MKLSVKFLSTFVLAMAAFATQGHAADEIKINGAGATFPFPLYSKWFSEFGKANTDTQINYQSIGSGGGIKQFSEGVVDFGATDAPMNEEQMKNAKEPVLHIPMALGAVVVTYNLKDVKDLKLTPEVLANIFLGKIKSWDDEALKKLNPNAALPKSSIAVVHRSDGSGTSAIFTDYLSKISGEWKTKVGSATAVNWPAGLGGKGNEGVTGLVKQTPNSIGYVELIYASKNNLPHAAIKNQSGDFVQASLQTVTAAAEGSLAKIPNDFRVSITNAEGKDSYPISGFTYLLVWEKKMDKKKGEKIVKFLKWAIAEGQSFAKDLEYAKLPPSLVKRVASKIDTIEFSNAAGH